LKFGNGGSLFASDAPKDGVLVWSDIDDNKVCESKSASELKKLAQKHLLCISGNHLEKVILW
jgi:hypothetical protein